VGYNLVADIMRLSSFS